MVDHTKISSESGISLVQLAIILVIISIMMVPFFQLQDLRRKTDAKRESTAQVGDVMMALRQFALTNGRYPLPAAPRYSIYNNINSGAETGPITDNDITGFFKNICGKPVGEGLKCVDGARDAFGSGTGLPSDANNRVVIGVIPYAALGLNPSQSLDRWGNKLTYAVTFGLTKASLDFRNDRGTIQLIDQNGDPLLLASNATSSNNVHFVVISHGQNKRGAFRATSGTPILPCPANNVALERENCESQNATFRVLSDEDTVGGPLGTPTSNYRLPGQNVSGAFDDEVSFLSSVNMGSWTAQKIVKAGDPTIYQSYLSYRGGDENVILGIEQDKTPSSIQKAAGAGQVQVLSIRDLNTGDVTVPNNVKAEQINTEYICALKNASSGIVRPDLRGDVCFKPDFFTNEEDAVGVKMALQAISPEKVDATFGSNRYYLRVWGGPSASDAGKLQKDVADGYETTQGPSTFVGKFGQGSMLNDTCLTGTKAASGLLANGKLKCVP